jgi:hypothetical protein
MAERTKHPHQRACEVCDGEIYSKSQSNNFGHFSIKKEQQDFIIILLND